jgi:hypothetical protein
LNNYPAARKRVEDDTLYQLCRKEGDDEGALKMNIGDALRFLQKSNGKEKKQKGIGTRASLVGLSKSQNLKF